MQRLFHRKVVARRYIGRAAVASGVASELTVPRGVKFIPENPQALALAYRNGQTAAQIAQGLGCSADTIGRLLQAQGVQLREAGRPRRAVDAEEVARLHKGGWSLTELAQIFGCHRGTITQRLVEAGAKLAPADADAARARS